ncbi:nucleotidyltransferase family protein [Syntrophomonas wolfei]|jgi:predicted nucleotidyltransferase|uniref:nucleotidyltransferase family protein n=1 Tax=Syntrophomonas wolfei TaxID=863 RepID=UPI0023F19D80|nr:nucleotidyltransferase domain-containing protein [Syntrophomonas wolfei]
MIGSKEWREACLQKGLSQEFLDTFLQNRHKNEKARKERNEQARQKASKIAVLLKDKYQAKKVYLYGSLVWGKFHERSDIDILVVNLKGDYWKAWVEVEATADPFPFDLVCYEDAFPSLREKVLEQGLEL